MELKVKTEFNSDIIKQSLVNDEYPMQNQTFEIIKLKDKGVTDALIALGWTPPDKVNRGIFDETIKLIINDQKDRRLNATSDYLIVFNVTWRQAQYFMESK